MEWYVSREEINRQFVERFLHGEPGEIIQYDANREPQKVPAPGGGTMSSFDVTDGANTTTVTDSDTVEFSSADTSVSITNTAGVFDFSVAAGSGDMTKVVYDPDDDGVIALAQLDADVVDTSDARLSDARTPTAHAGTHVTGGGDTIANAIAAGNSGLMSGADKTKLDGIAAGAEVNVNADWNAVAGDAQILNKPSIPTQYTDELAQDAVGGILLDDTTLDFTYDDGTPNITAVVIGMKESGGTKLAAGSIVDGEFLKRVGNNIVSAAVSGSAAWTTIFKTADQSKTSDAVLAADNTLQFAMTINKTYIIRGHVFFDTAATPDFKFSITGADGTSRATLGRSIPGAAAGTDAITESTIVNAGSTTYVASTSMTGTGTTGGMVRFTIQAVAGANGTFAFNWSQDTSNASATKVLAGSFLEYRQVD